MTKSNKIRQLLALFVISASIALVVIIVARVNRVKVTKEVLRQLPKNIDVSLQKIHFTETRDGVKRWDLVADKADYDKGNEVIHLTGVRLVLACGRSTGDVTIEAPQADYYNSSKNVLLKGKVVAKSASGMEFQTEDASYISSRGVITSSKRVRFSDGKLILEGIGMEFKPETKNFRILSGVTADIVTGVDR